jgi:hypothetical protein
MKLAKQSLSHWDLPSQKAAFQWAVQSMTEFMNQIFVRGEPSSIMQEVSSLACLLMFVNDREFVKGRSESLSAKVLEFPSRMGQRVAPSLGAAFAKVGEFQRALEISDRIECAVERCECLGRTAAELGDRKDPAASKEAKSFVLRRKPASKFPVSLPFTGRD